METITLNNGAEMPVLGWALALALTLSVLAGCSTPELPAASTPPSRTPVSESVSAKRVDDFYAAVNETVLKEHDAEKTGGWNWFYDLEDKSYQEQKAIIQAAATAPGDTGSSEYKLGTLYALAMDQARRDAEGVTCFNELMKPVMEAGTIGELMDALAVLQYCYGFDTLLNIEVLALDDTPGEYTAQIKNMNFGLDVSDFEYEEAEEENRAYFTDYLAHLLTLTGREDGEKAAGEVYEFVKVIVAGRNEGEYKKISVDDIQKQLPNIDLQAYLEKIFHTMPTELNTRETASLSVLNSYLTADHLPLLKDYVYLVNLEKFAPYITSEMRKAKFEMEETYIGGADPVNPEKTAVTQVAALLKWDIGKLYAEKNYTAEKRDAVW